MEDNYIPVEKMTDQTKVRLVMAQKGEFMNNDMQFTGKNVKITIPKGTYKVTIRVVGKKAAVVNRCV